MPQYPPSSFEALVGNFLNTYGAVKGMRQQQQESDIRRRQADRQDQIQQAQLDEQGYDVVPMPKIEAPPGQSFAQKIGSFLTGGPDQPGSVVMKTHQSTREREIADSRAAHVSDVAEEERYGLELEGIRAADARKLGQQRDAADMERTRANNQTQITVAGIQKQPNQKDAAKDDLSLKHQVIDDAIEANGGFAQKAYDQLPVDVKKKYRIGATDMNAGTQRFIDRRAALAREAVQSREDIADKKGAAGAAIRARLLGTPAAAAPAAPASGDPVATMSDADAWEYYVKQGLTPAAATAKVQGRKR